MNDTKVIEAAVAAAIKSAIELAGGLLKWGKRQVQSGRWRRRLNELNRELLLPSPDLQRARDLVDLAEEAGFAGHELKAVKQRLRQVVNSGKPRSAKRVARKKKRRRATSRAPSRPAPS